jgi:hypothetical protein
LDDPSNTRLLITTNTKKLALISIMTATAIATNYLMIGTLNIKFMDLIVFTTGYLLGTSLGATTGVLVWLVYGVLNPFGFSLPIWLSTMFCETMYGASGGYFAQQRLDGIGFDPWIAATGFLVTFVYDLITNIVSGVTVGIPIKLALITGIPFMLAHIASNTVFFGFGFKPLAAAIRKVMVNIDE